MPDNKEKIIEVLYDAVHKSFTALFKEHSGEHFYYCTLVMADATTPCISAQSEESLERYIKEENIDEDDIPDIKWSWADSPYCAYGYDEYFGEVEKLFEERFNNLEDEDDESKFELEYSSWMDAMETVMKMLDEKGFFGMGKEREAVFIYSEESPPDDVDESFYERAKRMNPSATYENWLASFEE